jgi:hypothetical protein
MEVQGNEKKIPVSYCTFYNANRSSRSGALPAGWYYNAEFSLSLWLLRCCAIRLQHIQLTRSKSVSKWHLGLTVSGLVAGLVLERNGSNTRTPSLQTQPASRQSALATVRGK